MNPTEPNHISSDCPDSGFDLRFVNEANKTIEALDKHIKSKNMTIPELIYKHKKAIKKLAELNECKDGVDGYKKLLELPESHDRRLFYKRGEIESLIELGNKSYAQLKEEYTLILEDFKKEL